MLNQRCVLAGIAGLALQGYAVLGMADSAPDVEVVATKLESPRGLDFAPNGQLYVTETGKFASGACTQTGLISRIDLYKEADSARVPVLTGLPAYGDVGPADISFLGMQGYVVIGLATDPNARESLDCGEADKYLLGSVIRMNPSYGYKHVADISEFERSYNNGAGNPDGGQVQVCNVPTNPGEPCPDDPPVLVDSYDTNPFGIVAEPGRLVVSDAGANDLIEVRANGNKKRLLGVFPAGEGGDRVPSRVTRGPDGYLYVGEEAFGAGTGGARVYRVPPNGCDDLDACPIYEDEFTSIMDLEFDRAGNLYVLEYASFTDPIAGNQLIKVDRKGNRTILADSEDGLDGPGGLALSPDGRYAYVTNKATCSGDVSERFCPDGSYGEVLRIRLHDRRPRK